MPGDTILIIEDNADYRLLLGRILKQAGYQVAAAPDGERGLKLLAEKKPLIVFLDINMPGIDGYEVCRRIRADKAQGKVPIIFITVRSEPQSVIQGMKMGGDDYIFKPFIPEEVLSRLRAVLRRSLPEHP